MFVWVTVIAAILIFTMFKLDVSLDDDLSTSLNTRFVFVFIATSGFTSLVAFFAKTALKRLFEKQDHLVASQDRLRIVNRRLRKGSGRPKGNRMRLAENEKQIRRLSDQTEQFSLAAASMIGMRDQQEIFHRISHAIVLHSDYRRVIISLFKKEPPFRDIVGFGGVETEVIDRLRSVEMPKRWYNGVFEKGIKVGRMSYYIPHTMKHILNQEATLYGQGAPPETDRGLAPGGQPFCPDD